MNRIKERAEALTRHMRQITGVKRGRIVGEVVRGTSACVLSIESKSEIQLVWFDGYVHAMEQFGVGHAIVDPDEDAT